MTENESLELAVFTSEAWPQSKMTEGTCTIYAVKFLPLDYASTKAAILRIMDTNDFRPSFAEIRKAVNRKRNDGAVGALEVHESLSLPEGEKRESKTGPRILDLLTRLTRDKSADTTRRAAAVLAEIAQEGAE